MYPDFIAQKWFNAQLYPDHPFGQAGFVSPAELKGVTREDAQAFVSSLYRPGNGVAVVHGGITMADVKTGTEQYLGSWRGGGGGGALSVAPAPEGPKERQIRLVNRDKATQAVVSIGCRLAAFTPETLPAYDVLEAVANESAWAIREQYGATYGVHAGVRRNADRSASLAAGRRHREQAGRTFDRAPAAGGGIAGQRDHRRAAVPDQALGRGPGVRQQLRHQRRPGQRDHQRQADQHPARGLRQLPGQPGEDHAASR